MRIVERVPIDAIQRHLKSQHSGVGLDLAAMPGPPCDYLGYKVSLDDARKIVLYWEFERYTSGGTCRLNDLLPPARSLERVRRFLDGDPARGFPPADLRVLRDKELAIVTNDLQGEFLYVIDGNHRVIAQHFSGRGLQGVAAFVCQHPEMMKWAYVPTYYQRGASKSIT